jgi:catechol 2,3-dioxygenase-like lactoylglutathione lyase family enzyme
MKLIIDIKVTNLERATHFYENILGFKCRVKKENWSAILVGDSEIHLYTDGGTTGHVEFYVEDIDGEVKRLSKNGIEFISGINKPNAIEVDLLKITKFPWGRTASAQNPSL